MDGKIIEWIILGLKLKKLKLFFKNKLKIEIIFNKFEILIRMEMEK